MSKRRVERLHEEILCKMNDNESDEEHVEFNKNLYTQEFLKRKSHHTDNDDLSILPTTLERLMQRQKQIREDKLHEKQSQHQQQKQEQPLEQKQAYEQQQSPAQQEEPTEQQLSERHMNTLNQRPTLVVAAKATVDEIEKNWRQEEVERLIEFWGEHDELYNATNPLYMDKTRKSLLLRQVAEMIGTTEGEVRKKMRSLHSYYCQIRREGIKKSRCGSRKTTRWPFFKQMRFLDENPQARKTISNLSSPSNDTNLELYVANSSPSPSCNRPKKLRRDDNHARHNELFSRAVGALDNDVRLEPAEESEDEAYGKLIAKKLAKIQEGDVKEDLKLELMQCIRLAQRRVSSNI